MNRILKSAMVAAALLVAPAAAQALPTLGVAASIGVQANAAPGIVEVNFMHHKKFGHRGFHHRSFKKHGFGHHRLRRNHAFRGHSFRGNRSFRQHRFHNRGSVRGNVFFNNGFGRRF